MTSSTMADRRAQELARWAEMRELIERVPDAPILYRVLGTGVTLLGWQREVPGTDMHIKGYWLTVLFVPLIPLQFYLIKRDGQYFRFYGGLSLRSFIRLYGRRSWGYLLTAILESIWLFLIAIFILACALAITAIARGGLRAIIG